MTITGAQSLKPLAPFSALVVSSGRPREIQAISIVTSMYLWLVILSPFTETPGCGDTIGRQFDV